MHDTQEQLFYWLEGLIPQIKSAADAEPVFLKFAEEKNISPALLEKLGHMYNTALTFNVIEKSSNKGGDFTTLNPERLLERYTEYNPKTASDSFAKAASTPVHAEDDKHLDFPGGILNMPAVATTKSADKNEESEPTYFEIRNAYDCTVKYAENAGSLREEEYDNLIENAEKAYQAVLRDDRGLEGFDGIEADLLRLSGGRLKDACDYFVQLRESEGFQVKRGHDDGRKRAVFAADCPYHAFSRLDDSLLRYDSVREMVDEAERSLEDLKKKAQGAGVGTQRQTRRQAPAPSAKDPEGRQPMPMPPYPEPRRISGVEPELAILQSAILGADQSLGRPSDDLYKFIQDNVLRPEDVYAAQKEVDTAYSDTQAQSVLETLMIEDPEIGSAPEQMVASLAEAIYEADPGTARDHNAMRFALREALQYGGLDPTALRGMLETSERREKIDKLRRERRSDRYGSGRPPRSKDDDN